MTDVFVVCSFYVYFALFLLVELVFTRSRLGSKGQGDRDRLSLLFFFICPFFGMVLWMAAVNHKWVSANPTWAQWILGVVLGLTGFAIRIIAKKTLGRFYTVRVQLQQDHEVIDTGIYGLVRHPLYLGFILEWLAPPLILGSPAGFLLTTLPIVIGVLQRIPREEALLTEGMGEKYRAYMGRTKRLIPGVW
ncbi:MAG TPA: isoprenylcysteine carboxylmethyltransferase family protein [Candidatus Limnocylindrales bacterium]|nr:isoprenylcysteine carboxylmethyltransferase family protein [Candidatus Limnocylindrales bacterium]